MDNEWRDRLIKAIESDGRSLRALSKAAGLGENYLFQMIDRGTAPTMPGLLALCRTLNLSPLYVLTGLQASPDVDELLDIAGKMDREKLAALIALVRQMNPAN